MDRVKRLSNSHRPHQPQVQVAVASPSLLSAKNLDLVSLAICSCVLTLLFHSAANLPQTSGGANSAPQPANSSSGTHSAGFQPYTLASSKPEIKDEEER